MATKRTSFLFPKEAMAKLNMIKSRSYLDSDADVIRAAIHAYRDILAIADAGHRIVVRDKDGQEWPYDPYSPLQYPGMRARSESARHVAEASTVPDQFFFSGDAVKQIETIKKQSFAKSNADAIRIALTAYSEILTVSTNRDEIVVRDARGWEAIYSPRKPWRGDAVEFKEPAPELAGA